MTQYIYMMVGAAGAGKSTYIKNHFPDAFDGVVFKVYPSIVFAEVL